MGTVVALKYIVLPEGFFLFQGVFALIKYPVLSSYDAKQNVTNTKMHNWKKIQTEIYISLYSINKYRSLYFKNYFTIRSLKVGATLTKSH